MGKVIGIINQKGGVGKSTLATHLAMTLYHNLNYKKESNYVCVYDADNPQYSIASCRNEELKLIKMTTDQNNFYYDNRLKKIYNETFRPLQIFSGDIADVKEKIEVLKSNFEYSIIDVVGTVNTDGYDSEFLKIFDYVLIPMSNQFEVMRSTISFVSLIVAPVAMHTNLKYDIVFNNVDVRESSSYLETKNVLVSKGFNMLDSIIPGTKKYVRLYMRDGSKGTMSTLFPTYEKSMINLGEEILKKIND